MIPCPYYNLDLKFVLQVYEEKTSNMGQDFFGLTQAKEIATVDIHNIDEILLSSHIDLFVLATV